jgi:beta-glucanase (GH16 family)
MSTMLFTMLAALTCLALHAEKAASDPAQAYADEGYRLVWSQEFDQPGRPDESVWGYERGFVRNRELQWYQQDNAFVEGGHLIIEARRQRVPNVSHEPGSGDWRKQRAFAEYTSASLTTRGKHHWKYGRFEMRARIDTRAGLWPAWWTLGLKREGVRWPACGEIDIMEYYNGFLLANACWSAAGGSWEQHWDAVRKPLGRLGGKDWSKRFHVWRMDWDAESILLYVDGRLLNTVAVSRTLNPDGSNPFRAPHYMIVNLAIGGMNGGDPSDTRFPARYEIDYLRVYQQQP